MKLNRTAWRRRVGCVGLVFGLVGLMGGAAMFLADRHRPAGRGLTNPEAPATAALAESLRQAGR